MKPALALFLMALTALPAGAEELPKPEGCVLVATVQDDHCAVLNYFQCSGAGPVAFRKQVHYRGGEVERHAFNKNHGGLEIVTPAGGSHYKIVADGPHPRDALAKGSVRKLEHATLTKGDQISKATMVTTYTDTGKTRELAGATFHRLSYSSTIRFPASGSELHPSGSVLFNEALDLLVTEVDVSDGQGKTPRTIKLKSLSLEGQKGFGATKPKFGCN